MTPLLVIEAHLALSEAHPALSETLPAPSDVLPAPLKTFPAPSHIQMVPRTPNSPSSRPSMLRLWPPSYLVRVIVPHGAAAQSLLTNMRVNNNERGKPDSFFLLPPPFRGPPSWHQGAPS